MNNSKHKTYNPQYIEKKNHTTTQLTTELHRMEGQTEGMFQLEGALGHGDGKTPNNRNSTKIKNTHAINQNCDQQ